jgi:hypothetical protein
MLHILSTTYCVKCKNNNLEHIKKLMSSDCFRLLLASTLQMSISLCIFIAVDFSLVCTKGMLTNK